MILQDGQKAQKTQKRFVKWMDETAIMLGVAQGLFRRQTSWEWLLFAVNQVRFVAGKYCTG